MSSPPPGAPDPRHRRPPSTLHNLRHLVSATAFVRAGGFFYTILIRRILGPQLMGAWNAAEILINYLAAATIGLSYSAERLIPAYRARGEHNEERAARNTLLSWTIVELVIIGSGTALYAWLFGDRHSEPVRLALRWLPLMFAAQKILAVHLVLFKSTRAFRSLSLATAAGAVLDWTLLAWALLGGFRGMLIGAAVTGGLKVALYHNLWRFSEASALRLMFSRHALRPHFPYALRYSSFKASFTIVERLDPVLVGSLLGATSLGYYYLGHSLARLALEVPATVSYLAYPNLVEKHATADRDPGGLSAEYFKFLRLNLFLVLPVVLPMAFYGTELVVRLILPTFTPAIPSAKIIVATVSLMAVRLLIYQVLMCYERVGTLTWITAAQIPLFLAAFAALMPVVPDVLIRAAIAHYVACFGHAGLGFLTIGAHIEYRGQGMLGTPVSPLLVCIGWSLLLLGLDALWPLDSSGTLWYQLAQVAVRVALVWTLALPFTAAGLGPYRSRWRELLTRVLKGS